MSRKPLVPATTLYFRVTGRNVMTLFELNQNTLDFISTYKLFEDDVVQQIQLQHRLELVAAFDIQKGMHVLEIGCGQGDTTAALADAVGEDGHVVAIDIASRDYGAPLTLGQATDRIKNSALGRRIQFHFETDFSSFELTETFDAVVLSHCSWYFKRPRELQQYFLKIRGMTRKLCFAEWDLDFTNLQQRSHFYAASILALYSNFVDNDGNIQNLFDKIQIQRMLEQVGYRIDKQSTINATYLQDGQWEKDYANSIRSEFHGVSDMLQTMINSYYELMNVPNGDAQSLNSFIICTK